MKTKFVMMLGLLGMSLVNGAVVLTSEDPLWTVPGEASSVPVDLDLDGVPDFRLRSSFGDVEREQWSYSIVPLTGSDGYGIERNTLIAGSLAETTFVGSLLSQAPKGFVDVAENYDDLTGLNPTLEFTSREAYLSSEIFLANEADGQWDSDDGQSEGIAYFKFISFRNGVEESFLGAAEIGVDEENQSVGILRKVWEDTPYDSMNADFRADLVEIPRGTAVPEPKTILLGLCGIVALVMRRSR